MIKNKKEILKIRNVSVSPNESFIKNALDDEQNENHSQKSENSEFNSDLNLNIVLDKINKKSENDCKIHVMPPTISDEDINALFSGLVSIVRRKIELEARAEIINANLNEERLNRALKSKQAEISRLKNEILNLKSQLNK